MTFEKTKEYFLNERKEGKFYDSSIITYRRKLEIFSEFLNKRCGIDNNNFQELLRGIGSNKIIDSIEYYIDEYDIKFKVTVDNYFTVIRSYFDTISSKFHIKNENFEIIGCRVVRQEKGISYSGWDSH